MTTRYRDPFAVDPHTGDTPENDTLHVDIWPAGRWSWWLAKREHWTEWTPYTWVLGTPRRAQRIADRMVARELRKRARTAARVARLKNLGNDFVVFPPPPMHPPKGGSGVSRSPGGGR